MPHALICGVILSVIIDIKDVDHDSTHTHLLRADYVQAKACQGQSAVVQSNYNPIYISYSAPVSLGVEGQRVDVLMHADCYSASGVDEEATSDRNMWIAYRSWVCTATNIRVLTPAH
jgi:hypothetical protein